MPLQVLFCSPLSLSSGGKVVIMDYCLFLVPLRKHADEHLRTTRHVHENLRQEHAVAAKDLVQVVGGRTARTDLHFDLGDVEVVLDVAARPFQNDRIALDTPPFILQVEFRDDFRIGRQKQGLAVGVHRDFFPVSAPHLQHAGNLTVLETEKNRRCLLGLGVDPVDGSRLGVLDSRMLGRFGLGLLLRIRNSREQQRQKRQRDQKLTHGAPPSA